MDEMSLLRRAGSEFERRLTSVTPDQDRDRPHVRNGRCAT